MIPDVTIYTDPQCSECRQLREFLLRKQVPFYEHDATRDVSARAYLQELNVSRLPVTRVGDEHVFGFDEPRLNELIKTSEVASPTS